MKLRALLRSPHNPHFLGEIMIPDGVETSTLTGYFLNDEGNPIKNFLLKLQGSREGISFNGYYVDLGPQYLVLDSTGKLVRRNSNEPVKVVSNFIEDQPFYYKVEMSGCNLPFVFGVLEVPPRETIDVPKVILEQIPAEDFPEWADVLRQVLDARNQVVEIADRFENGDFVGEAVQKYLEDHPIEGVTPEYLEQVINNHINSPAPHPAYDQIPNLSLIFDNHLI